MIRSALTAFMILGASPCVAENVSLRIAISDGNPHDRIYLTNDGACTLVSGALTLDFTAAEGRIVIDTQYGGVGTKDPMPVEVETGNITVVPVLDGDREISILIGGLSPGQRAIVTLDMDPDTSKWFARRVSILSDDLAGTRARYEHVGFQTEAIFGSGGVLHLALPEEACVRAEPVEPEVPIS